MRENFTGKEGKCLREINMIFTSLGLKMRTSIEGKYIESSMGGSSNDSQEDVATK